MFRQQGRHNCPTLGPSGSLIRGMIPFNLTTWHAVSCVSNVGHQRWSSILRTDLGAAELETGRPFQQSKKRLLDPLRRRATCSKPQSVTHIIHLRCRLSELIIKEPNTGEEFVHPSAKPGAAYLRRSLLDKYYS